MQFKRVFISFSLLLAYSIGFAHDLIPHCHHSELGEKLVAEHSDEHHQHHESHHHEAKHEQEHMYSEQCMANDGLLCFLMCLLSEGEHPATNANNCYYVPANGNEFSGHWLSKTKIVVALVTLFTAPTNELLLPGFSTEVFLAYLSPPLECSPHRGPPSVSC